MNLRTLHSDRARPDQVLAVYACPDCGFDASAVEAPEVAERVQALTAPWPAVLSRPEVRRRPEPKS